MLIFRFSSSTSPHLLFHLKGLPWGLRYFIELSSCHDLCLCQFIQWKGFTTRHVLNLLVTLQHCFHLRSFSNRCEYHTSLTLVKKLSVSWSLSLTVPQYYFLDLWSQRYMLLQYWKAGSLQSVCSVLFLLDTWPIWLSAWAFFCKH